MVTREVRMDIVALHRQGLSNRQIAKRLGIHRDTVSGYLDRGCQPPPSPASGRESAVGAFTDRIKAWMEEDDYHATWMYQRLKVLGFADINHLRGEVAINPRIEVHADGRQRTRISISGRLDHGGGILFSTRSLYCLIMTKDTRICYAALRT